MPVGSLQPTKTVPAGRKRPGGVIPSAKMVSPRGNGRVNIDSGDRIVCICDPFPPFADGKQLGTCTGWLMETFNSEPTCAEESVSYQRVGNRTTDISRRRLAAVLILLMFPVGCLHMRVSPGRVIVPLDQSVSFGSSLYNDKGQLPNTGPVIWSVYNVTEHRPARISRDGTFTARLPGKYKVTAASGSHKGRSTIVVPDGLTWDPSLKPSPTSVSSLVDTGTLPPALAPPDKDDTAWNDSNFRSAFSAENRKGRDPLRSFSGKRLQNADAGMGNGNYGLKIPLLKLQGRGVDLVLDLFYNSQLWAQVFPSKVRNSNTDRSRPEPNIMLFNADKGWPSPGWSLGFGKLRSFLTV